MRPGEHHGGRVSRPEARHRQPTVTHNALRGTGGRTEDRDDVGGRCCDVRALRDDRHRSGGPLLQRLVHRLGGAAGAPALRPGDQDLGQHRDHQDGAAQVGDRHDDQEGVGPGVGHGSRP